MSMKMEIEMYKNYICMEIGYGGGGGGVAAIDMTRARMLHQIFLCRKSNQLFWIMESVSQTLSKFCIILKS